MFENLYGNMSLSESEILARQKAQIEAANTMQQKQENNFFSNMKKKYDGVPNFVWYLKPEQIQKSAKDRIFREMIRGQISYDDNGQYFQDSKFLENLIIAAQDELINNSTIRDALVYYDSSLPGNQNVITLRARYENLVYIYNVLYNKLMNVKMSGNVGCLIDIQNILGAYRNAL